MLAQGFINLNFESSFITNARDTGYGFASGAANIPGWTTFDSFGEINYAGGTTVAYNIEPLDGAAVSLEGTNYWTPVIQGRYSLFIKGGSQWAYYPRNGRAMAQTGQIPLSTLSLTYWGSSWNGLVVTFNRYPLSFMDIGDTTGHTVWGADVSAYAGQTGELRFTAPWLSAGMLDNIQFLPTTVPKPSTLGLLTCGIGCPRFIRPRRLPFSKAQRRARSQI